MQAILEVIVEIDTDQMEELQKQGENEHQIERRIRNSITLKESCMRQPVEGISEVRIIKYLGD